MQGLWRFFTQHGCKLRLDTVDLSLLLKCVVGTPQLVDDGGKFLHDILAGVTDQYLRSLFEYIQPLTDKKAYEGFIYQNGGERGGWREISLPL